MIALRRSFKLVAGCSVLLALVGTCPAHAQMVSGSAMPGYGDTFGIDLKAQLKYHAELAQSSAPGNVLWPGEQPTFTIQIQNGDTTPILGPGKIDIIRYGSKGLPGDIWTPVAYKIGDTPRCPSMPISRPTGFRTS